MHRPLGRLLGRLNLGHNLPRLDRHLHHLPSPTIDPNLPQQRRRSAAPHRPNLLWPTSLRDQVRQRHRELAGDGLAWAAEDGLGAVVGGLGRSIILGGLPIVGGVVEMQTREILGQLGIIRLGGGMVGRGAVLSLAEGRTREGRHDFGWRGLFRGGVLRGGRHGAGVVGGPIFVVVDPGVLCRS